MASWCCAVLSHALKQRAGARGALFLHGIVPLGYFGDRWPAGVPLQIHMMRGDPYEDPAEVQALAEAAHGELFEYELGRRGDRHERRVDQEVHRGRCHRLDDRFALGQHVRRAWRRHHPAGHRGGSNHAGLGAGVDCRPSGCRN